MTAPRQWDEAIGKLPYTYSLALRLRAAGVTDDLMAECLGVEPEAIGPLLALADSKLAAACESLGLEYE